MPEKTKTVTFKWEKDTKNKRVFAEQPAPGEAAIIGTLYVEKTFAEGAAEVEVTIKVK